MLNIRIGNKAVNVDPDSLSPTARALAEAIQNTDSHNTVDIWMESDEPISATPGWENWYTPDEASHPERRPWRGWSRVPLGPAEDPHARLEYEARKIPPGWHVYGAAPDRPNAERTRVGEGDSKFVLAYLAQHGRTITPATWRSYVGRGQAPAPVRHVGRTPLWRIADIDAWLERS